MLKATAKRIFFFRMPVIVWQTKRGTPMYKRQAAISVRFTDEEKKEVTDALSVYGDVAVCARMILLSFAKDHQESKRMWPPESRPAGSS